MFDNDMSPVGSRYDELDACLDGRSLVLPNSVFKLDVGSGVVGFVPLISFMRNGTR